MGTGIGPAWIMDGLRHPVTSPYLFDRMVVGKYREALRISLRADQDILIKAGEAIKEAAVAAVCSLIYGGSVLIRGS